MQEETQTTLENTGLIDLPKFDCKPYIGKEAQITSVTEHEGQYGFYVKGETEPIAKFGEKDIRASKIFGLFTDADGKIGWGKDTKLGIYLEKMKVQHYKELVGKSVIIQIRTNKEGNDFLDFN